jgi:hypothetical protein
MGWPSPWAVQHQRPIGCRPLRLGRVGRSCADRSRGWQIVRAGTSRRRNPTAQRCTRLAHWSCSAPTVHGFGRRSDRTTRAPGTASSFSAPLMAGDRPWRRPSKTCAGTWAIPSLRDGSANGQFARGRALTPSRQSAIRLGQPVACMTQCVPRWPGAIGGASVWRLTAWASCYGNRHPSGGSADGDGSRHAPDPWGHVARPPVAVFTPVL